MRRQRCLAKLPEAVVVASLWRAADNAFSGTCQEGRRNRGHVVCLSRSGIIRPAVQADWESVLARLTSWGAPPKAQHP